MKSIGRAERPGCTQCKVAFPRYSKTSGLHPLQRSACKDPCSLSCNHDCVGAAISYSFNECMKREGEVGGWRGGGKGETNLSNGDLGIDKLGSE